MKSSHQGLFNHSFSSPGVGYDSYSNLFDSDFLNQLLDLQNAIVFLEASMQDSNGKCRSVHLSNICFKPLYPNIDECAVQSPLNYFQNNRTRLNAHVTDPDFDFIIYADYMDHLRDCLK